MLLRTRRLQDGGCAGDLPLSLEVRDADDKVVANGKTTIRVATTAAGTGQPLRLLCIGDSGTHASAYTAELMKSCAGPDQPRLTLLGTHHPPFAAPGNVHEGYGGWRFQDFLEKYTDKPVPGDHANRSSPFVFGSPKGPVFDVPRYIRESCGGVPPEYVQTPCSWATMNWWSLCLEILSAAFPSRAGDRNQARAQRKPATA